MAYNMDWRPSAAELDEAFGDLALVEEPVGLAEPPELPEPPAHTYVRTAHAIDSRITQSTDLATALELHHSRFPGAACKKVEVKDPDAKSYIEFRPGRGESTNPARLVCKSCVHEDWCLKYALDTTESIGIWGGSSERGRRRIVTAYNKAVEAGEVDPSTTTVGDFGVANRSKFIKPPNPRGPTNSSKLEFPPKRLKITPANCLNKDSDLFEELDITPREKITKQQLALAIVSCRTCVFYEYCANDPVRLDKESQPTVVGGEIQGAVPASVVPSERFIQSLTPQPPKPPRLPRSTAPKPQKKVTELDLGPNPDLSSSAFVRLGRDNMMPVIELEDFYVKIKQYASKIDGQLVTLDDICDFEFETREGRTFEEDSVLHKVLKALG